MTVVLCQHFGADLGHHPSYYVEAPSTGRCFDCGMASADGGAWQPSFQAEGDPVPAPRLEPGRRLALGLALHDVPFRWEPGPIIVVGEEGRSLVDAFLEGPGTGIDGAGNDTDGVVAAVLLHAFMPLLPVWARIDSLRSLAGAAFDGALAGVAMCAGVRWTASQGGGGVVPRRRASSPRRRP